eukprot:gb/GECH01006964.1/.p1 GENE.gb/GECH01006964.1/~~gb/GECH01006964.1/.p1  ORF type:complete len:400 (+),score=101.41 gb/GECH01006964.1/:1-1200(+)
MMSSSSADNQSPQDSSNYSSSNQPQIGSLSQTPVFKEFKGSVALRKVSTNLPEPATWTYQEWGPKQLIPLILLPGVCGNSEIFFQQLTTLGAKGYHVVAVSYPAYWTQPEFVIGFCEFLDAMQFKKVHICGVSLGGFLAQCFAAQRPNRILSLILSNTFCDNQPFSDNAPCMEMFRYMPGFMLRRTVLKNFPSTVNVSTQDGQLMAAAVDFMVDQLDTLSQATIASRMTLNCLPVKIGKLRLDDEKITIIDTTDDTTVNESMKQELYKKYPNARLGLIKIGGAFPYLSSPDQFNLHLEVHLRQVGKQNLPQFEKTVENDTHELMPHPTASSSTDTQPVASSSSDPHNRDLQYMDNESDDDNYNVTEGSTPNTIGEYGQNDNNGDNSSEEEEDEEEDGKR